MTTMIAEVYDALKDAGASDAKARKAAEVLASGDVRHQELLLQFTKLESRVDKFARMVGMKITLTLVVLSRQQRNASVSIKIPEGIANTNRTMQFVFQRTSAEPAHGNSIDWRSF